MPTFYDDLYDRFCEMHSEIEKAVEGLPSEALDWVPGPEMNSMTVLVAHLTGAENYWIGVALNEPPGRDREAEFRAKGLGAAELMAYVVSADNFARRALARFSLPDLEVIRHSPRNDKAFNVGWCLTHAIEHTALHTGHIQLTRQLWSLRRPIP
ncbi:MAG TPA: DinB family protein [Anaerolineales bacterium]